MAIFIKNIVCMLVLPLIFFLLQIKTFYTNFEVLIAFTKSLACATKFLLVFIFMYDNFSL